MIAIFSGTFPIQNMFTASVPYTTVPYATVPYCTIAPEAKLRIGTEIINKRNYPYSESTVNIAYKY